MSTYSDFSQMAQEMLSDPDVCSNATLITTVNAPIPGKPWEQSSVAHSNPVTCFYYKPKDNMVNGTVILTGQKALLFKSDVPRASLMLATWIDSLNKSWQIKQVEPIELNDQIICYKVLIGV